MTCGGDKTIRIWDSVTGKDVRKLAGHKAAVYGIAFAPGGRLLSCSADRKVKAWDYGTGLEFREWPEHRAEVYAVACSANGERIVTGGKDRSLLLWSGDDALPAKK